MEISSAKTKKGPKIVSIQVPKIESNTGDKISNIILTFEIIWVCSLVENKNHKTREEINQNITFPNLFALHELHFTIRLCLVGCNGFCNDGIGIGMQLE